MSERSFYVYAYFRLDGSPCYVGKGKGDRWLHRGKHGRNLHFLRLREQAKAQGQDLPREKIIENLTEQEALDFEGFFIRALGREIDGGILVNLSLGGDRGPVGYRYTPEQREAHGLRRRGRKHSPAWCEAISAGMKASEKVAANVVKAGRATRGIKKSSGWWSTEEGRAKQRANNPGGRNMSAEAIETCRRAAIRGHASSTTRKAVIVSTTWANQNSVRYPLAAAA